MDEARTRAAVWDLTSEDQATRTRGFTVIKEAGGAAVPILLSVAREWDEQHQVRWLGVYAGGSPTDFLAHAVGDAAAVEPLAAVLDDPAPRLRAFAVCVISDIDDPRVPDLLAKAVRDKDAQVRRNAVYGLQRLGDQRSFDLVTAALVDSDERVRSTATRAMRWIGGPDCVGDLIRLLDDPSDKVAWAAASTLGHLAVDEAMEPLLALLKSGRGHLPCAAAEAVARIGDVRAVISLLETLTATEDSLVRSSVAAALAKLGCECTVEPLIALLQAPDCHLRKKTLEVLGVLRDRRAADPIASLLQDSEPAVARAAAFALAEIGDERAVEPMVKLLHIEPRIEPVKIGVKPDRFRDEDMNRLVRERAARALGALGDGRASESLAELLDDSAVGRAAASSLARCGDSRGVGHLLKLLQVGDRRYRAMVVSALGDSGSPLAVPSLIDLAGSADGSWASTFALAALGKIGTEDAIAAVQSVMSVAGADATEAALALAKIGRDSAFDYLRTEIQAGDERSRLKSVRGLGFIGTPRAAVILVDALLNDFDTVKVAAAQALGRIGYRPAAGPLRALLDSEDRRVKTAGFRALNKLTQAGRADEVDKE